MPLPVVLDVDTNNFSKWSILFKALLGRHGLLSHVDGTAPANPTDAVWLQDDYAVRSVIYGSVTGDTLDMIIDDDQTARELYTAAENLFRDNKDARSILLLNSFHSLQQGDLSVTAYCKEQKRLADALRDVGSTVDDRLLTFNTLRGLNERMAPAATPILIQPVLPSFTNARSLLLMEEMRLNNTAKTAAATALVSKGMVLSTTRFWKQKSFGQSVAYVSVDGTLAGLICFEDKLREYSHHVIDTLSKQGIDVYMLSGDKKSAAMNVASIVGIQEDKVLAEVKPHEKKKFISELQKEHRLVAMVGDGINDAAALASADIGIAMGGGVGAASDVSSVVLMGNRLVDALELSKETMRIVKQNLWWAFLYNIVGLPIAAGALLPVTGTILTPSIAGALMGFSSVGVIANSLLLRVRLRQKPFSHSETTQKARTANIDALSDTTDDAEKQYPSKWRST
ncbi:hypothetical protein ACP70R_045992 [Stipagrostis hirtigluma subsp. patula]